VLSVLQRSLLDGPRVTHVLPTAIAGCFTVACAVHGDERGELRKPFEMAWLAEQEIAFEVAEVVWTTSQRNVVRGLHVQLPPAASEKFVWCARGHIWDVVLDLRSDQPTFGEHISIELGPNAADAVFVPSGCAHGFVALEDDSLVSYLISTPFEPALDAGVRWDSAGIDWQVGEPIVSERDMKLPAFEDFVSPF
jgi:dTDP-4-dehydrorhamnose 3,5-epimerase